MNDIIKAAMWMSGAIISFTAMAVAGRELGAELDTFEIMTYRSLIGAAIMAVVITGVGRWRDVSDQSIGLHFTRNTTHFIGQNLWFYALTLMPLAQLFAFEFTTPIWVILLTPSMLGGKLRLAGLLAALIAFVGILMVARPGIEPLGSGVWAAIGCAVGFALTYFFTQRLLKQQSIYAILLHMTWMQATFGLVLAGFDGDITLPGVDLIVPVLVVSITGLSAHLCISVALTLAPPSVCSPIDFVRLPAIAVVGALFYNEPFDIWVIFGAIFIFSGNYLNILSEMKNRAEITSR